MSDVADTIKHSFLYLLPYEREPNTISISSLPWCLRRAYFNIMFNANPDPTPKMIRGKIMHYALREMPCFQGCKFELRISQPLRDRWKLLGHIDVYDPENREVYEFKFTDRIDNHTVDPFYFAQANAYAVIMDAQAFYLVKVNPNTFDVLVLDGEPDKDAFTALKDRALMIIECIESKQLPPGPEQDWECRNCVYNVVCSRLDNSQSKLE